MAYTFVWSFILACNIHAAFGDLLHVPAQAEVIRGDSITIPCVTTFAGQYYVQWQHTPFGSHGAIDIYFAEILIRKNQREYYDIKIDKAKGEYNLTILSAAASDAGTYTCIDKRGAGQQRRAELIVLDSQPVGKSNVSLDQLAICGTEADYVGLSCQVNYTGDQSPNFEWMQIFDNGTEVTLSDQLHVLPDVGHDRVSYHLAMRTDPSMDGSVFRCQSTLAKYSWTSEELRIQYAFNSSSADFHQDPDIVGCHIISNQPCSYSWIQADDSQKIKSEEETLDLASVASGTYTCMAQCNIRIGADPCILHGKTIRHTEKYKSAGVTYGTVVAAVSAVILTILAVVLIIFFLCQRLSKEKKNKGEPEEIPLLLNETKLMHTASLEDLIVRGITELDDRIYVIFQDRPFIRVISDLVNFAKERDIRVNMMEEPWNLESCIDIKCLYVADRTPSCIWKVNPLSTAKPEKWMVGLKKPYKFSVISGGRIAIPEWPRSIKIFKTDGTLGEIVELPTDMLEPYYVLETARETYVVAHGHQKSMNHRTCEIVRRTAGQTSDWVVQWSYPENGLDKINNIDIMAMDSKGRIFVTDQNNHRIIVLSESGQKLNEIHTNELPYRLCYAQNSKQLLIGHQGAISVYKINDVLGGQLEIQYQLGAVCQSFRSERLSTSRKPAKNLEIHQQNDKMEIGENIVSGITELHNKFYVILQDSNQIRVFDERCEKSGNISVKNLADPWFIDACKQNNCLYVTDKGRECIVKIHDLDRKDGKVSVEIWKAKIGEPYKLSVISKGRVLIPVWPATLEVYDGQSKQLVDSIDLPDDMIEPCHAVEVDRGSYILGHGYKKSGTHRVCKIKYSSRKVCEVIWIYGNQRGKKIDQLNRPWNIAIGDRGVVFITDEGNRRLVMLDNNGNRLSMKTTDITPQRLFYSKSMSRLLVGHYGSINQYVVDEEDRLKCCSSLGCFTNATDA